MGTPDTSPEASSKADDNERLSNRSKIAVGGLVTAGVILAAYGVYR